MKHISIIATLLTALLLNACCKEGLDGKATVNATIMNGDSLVRGAVLYVKFDSKEAPADPAEYEVVVNAEPASGTITINNLECGDYFFFVDSYDASTGRNVKGGVSYSIRFADRKRNINITVPVTPQ